MTKSKIPKVGKSKKVEKKTSEKCATTKKKTRFQARHVFLTIYDMHWWGILVSALATDTVQAMIQNLAFLVGQLEVCPETGKTHGQLYVQFTKQAKSWSAVGRWLHWHNLSVGRIFEPEGTDEENARYCSKDLQTIANMKKESFQLADKEAAKKAFAKAVEWQTKGLRKKGCKIITWGKQRAERQKRSARMAYASSMVNIQHQIREGLSIKTIADEHFTTWARSYKAIACYKAMHDKQNVPDHLPCHVVVIWGDSDTNKSKRAVALAKAHGDGTYCVPSLENGKIWFTDYMGEQTLIINEFYGIDMTFKYFLKMTDWPIMTVAGKGQNHTKQWTQVIFTSNVDPMNWFKEQNVPDESWKGIKKRCRRIIHCYRTDKQEEPQWVKHEEVLVKKISLPE